MCVASSSSSFPFLFSFTWRNSRSRHVNQNAICVCKGEPSSFELFEINASWWFSFRPVVLLFQLDLRNVRLAFLCFVFNFLSLFSKMGATFFLGSDFYQKLKSSFLLVDSLTLALLGQIEIWSKCRNVKMNRICFVICVSLLVSRSLSANFPRPSSDLFDFGGHELFDEWNLLPAVKCSLYSDECIYVSECGSSLCCLVL